MGTAGAFCLWSLGGGTHTHTPCVRCLRSAFFSIIEITIPHDCATLLLLWLALSYRRAAIGACGDNGCEWGASPPTPRPTPPTRSCLPRLGWWRRRQKIA